MTVITATELPELAAVRLEVTGAPDGPATIQRTDARGQHPVRMPPGLEVVAGELIVTDYEPALSGLLTYAMDTATDTAQLDTAAPVFAAVEHPGRRVELTSVSDWRERSDTRATEHDVIGRADRLVIDAPMSMRTGSFTAWCPNYATAKALRDIAAPGGLHLLRVPDPAELDAWCTVRVLEVSQYPAAVLDPATGATVMRWQARFEFTEQPPEGPLLLGAHGWTVDALAEALETTAEVPLTFTTVRDLTVGP